MFSTGYSIRNIAFVSVILSLIFLRCVSSPFDEMVYAVHKTDHFTIYYQESEFSLQEIKRIGEKKERLLTHIKNEFESDYNGRITVYLFLYGTKYAYAMRDEEIHESRDYVINDDGHEIAHIVNFEELGYSPIGFLKEGIAVSLELRLSDFNAIEEFAEYRKDFPNPFEDSISVARQLGEDFFLYTHYSYRRAGAFVKYLMVYYGLDKLKEFYVKSIIDSSDLLLKDFTEIFGKDILTIEKEFEDKFYYNTFL